MKKSSLLLAFLSLSACVTTETTYLPDGSIGHHISCNGAASSMGDCMQKAGEVCGPTGYKVYKEGTEATPFTTSNGQVAGRANYYGSSYESQGSSTSSSFVQRDLFVKCNKEPVE